MQMQFDKEKVHDIMINKASVKNEPENKTEENKDFSMEKWRSAARSAYPLLDIS